MGGVACHSHSGRTRARRPREGPCDRGRRRTTRDGPWATRLFTIWVCVPTTNDPPSTRGSRASGDTPRAAQGPLAAVVYLHEVPTCRKRA